MAVMNLPTRLAFQSVVVATDFSPHSDIALACAAVIARRSKGKVCIAHVIAPPVWPLGGPEDLHPALCQKKRWAEKKMCGLLKSEKLRAVSTDVLLKEGEFRTVLCNATRDYQADLLIVGTRGRKGLSKLLFGSTAEEVCHSAPCPVMLIGPNVSTRREIKFDRILFPSDLSAPSLGALPSVLAFAEQHGSLLKFVRLLSEGEGQDSTVALCQLERDYMPTFTARTRLLKPPEFAVNFGDSAAEILRMAREWRADLVAIGAHRPGTLASHFPGDLVYEIVCDSTCPVLTITE